MYGFHGWYGNPMLVMAQWEGERKTRGKGKGKGSTLLEGIYWWTETVGSKGMAGWVDARRKPRLAFAPPFKLSRNIVERHILYMCFVWFFYFLLDTYSVCKT